MREWYRLGLVAHMQGWRIEDYLKMLRLDLIDPSGRLAGQVRRGYQSAEWRAQRAMFERRAAVEERR